MITILARDFQIKRPKIFAIYETDELMSLCEKELENLKVVQSETLGNEMIEEENPSSPNLMFNEEYFGNLKSFSFI